MSSNPFLGEIQIYPYNFAPRDWQWCHGQLVAISQNSALFSLLGTQFGGDGRTTFGLPDLQGRSVVGAGNGAGLTPVSQAEKSGHETVAQVVAHSHTATLYGEKAAQDSNNPNGKLLAQADIYTTPTDQGNKAMSAESVTVASTGQTSVNIRNPYLGLNYCIAMEGIYPSRS